MKAHYNFRLLTIEPGDTVCLRRKASVRNENDQETCHFLLAMKRKLADDPETLILAITTGQGRHVIRKHMRMLDVCCAFFKRIGQHEVQTPLLPVTRELIYFIRNFLFVLAMNQNYLKVVNS